MSTVLSPLQNDLRLSREYEMRVYLDSMREMYDDAVEQNGELYDIAFALTDSFRAITSQAILADSRLIKTLRYAIAPTISQMKFGQMFGLNSVERFERSRVSGTSSTARELTRIAPRIAKFISENIDRTRFIWLDDPSQYSNLAQGYAKKWTCSMAADQNAQTNYRNWRKQKQEHSIADHLLSLKYAKSAHKGLISQATDIGIGEFTQEIRVQGRTIQRADLVFRSRKSRKLVLLEAKAVGVELDATKRIKECCDKANDWSASAALGDPQIVAVIAGFFTEHNIANLSASNIRIVWEHRLSDLDSLT